MRIANTALIVLFCALISACGSGSSSSSSNPSSSNSTSSSASDSSSAQTTQNTTTSVAENYQAVTIGSASDFNNSVTLASLWKKVYRNLAWNNLQFVSSAHAVSSCSAPSKLVGAKSNATWEALAFSALDPSADSTIDDGDTSECITGIQDSAKFIVFVAANLSNNSNKCEVNFLNKANSKLYCLNTGVAGLLGATSSRAYARYQVGVNSSLRSVGGDFKAEYAMNSSGFQSVITRNGRYLFAPFAITVSNRNYVGITRFKLDGSGAPQSKVVWLKEQVVTNVSGTSVTSNYMRGFIGLENGDLVVDYLNDQGQSNGRPIEAAYRYYLAVDATVDNPANQPGFMLWQGNSSYWDTSYNAAGALYNYLAAHDPMNAVDTSGNSVSSYFTGSTPTLYSITSDPGSTARSIIVKIAPSANGRAGPMLDIIKVNIAVNNGSASISGVQSLGRTTAYYPMAIIGNKIYSWNRQSSYTKVGGASENVDMGIVSHPIDGGTSAQDSLVYRGGTTFSFSTYATRNAFFVMEGFWGYFGGTLQGTNYIYQMKQASNGSESVTNVNIGPIASGLYTIKTVSANPITDQLQVSGSKKASMSDYSDTTQWSAFISKAGVKQLRVYSTMNALADDKPVLSLKDENGSSVNYASTY